MRFESIAALRKLGFGFVECRISGTNSKPLLRSQWKTAIVELHLG